MMTPCMVSLAALDERQEEVQVCVSPLGDQSIEVDAEAETAAFVARPDPVREVETIPMIIKAKSGSNKRSAFADMAPLLFPGGMSTGWSTRFTLLFVKTGG